MLFMMLWMVSVSYVAGVVSTDGAGRHCVDVYLDAYICISCEWETSK